MTFDPTKPVQTRDGRKARILCTDLKTPDGYPLVVAVEYSDGEAESLRRYASDGSFSNRETMYRPEDLINTPQRHKHADVIIAWANGAKVEFREEAGREWMLIDVPSFSDHYEYRIAGEQP